MRTECTEQELVAKCIDGDSSACRQLYEEYGGQLFAISLRYIGNHETAEDVFHDGFLRIIQSLQKFRYMGPGSLKAWMSRVMVNEALGYLRKRNAQMQQEVEVDVIPDLEDDDEEDDAVDEIPHAELLKLISELPDGYRTVFNLYVFEEKSHKEIADVLGITEHTSSSQFYRAKTLLIKKINEYKKKHQ